MDTKEYYHYLDEVVQSVYFGIVAKSNKATEIQLTDIDVTNDAHLAVICIANAVTGVTGWPLKIRLGFWDFWKLRRRHPFIKQRIKESYGEPISVRNLVMAVCMHYNDMLILDEIYEEYYKPMRGKKK